jgi:hypothetical protein
MRIIKKPNVTGGSYLFQRIFSSDHPEGVPFLFRTFPKYVKFFRKIINHQTLSGGVSGLVPNSIYFFCESMLAGATLGEEHFLSTARRDLRQEVCWDFRGVGPEYIGKDTFRGTRTVFEPIYVMSCMSQKRFVGYFIPEKKTLFLCDLTHHSNNTCTELVSRILDYFIKKKAIERVHKASDTRTPRMPIVRPSLGTDPEFEGIDEGEIVNGPEMPFFRNRRGTMNLTSPSCKIGLDGASSPIELRPDPAPTPEQAIENLRSLFKEASVMEMTVAGNHFSLGGHIHLGGIRFNHSEDMPFIKLLDHLIGRPTYKMNGRARCDGYKELTQVEPKSYGFEYRSLPAAVFYDPELARLIYKAAQEAGSAWYSYKAIKIEDNLDIDLKNIAKFTDAEIAKYHELIDNYRAVETNVIAAWVDGVSPSVIPEKPITIEFLDCTYHTQFKSLLSTALNGIMSTNIRRIHFYGLAATRGTVFAGLAVPGFINIDHDSCGVYGRVLKIGLPYNLRLLKDRDVAFPPEFFVRFAQAVAQAVASA